MGQWLEGRAQLSADQSAKAPRHRLFSQHPKVGEGRGCFFNFFPTEIERIQICSSEKLQICSSESFSVLMHALQAEFQEQLVKIKEHTRQKDEEIEGGWYTEERLEKDLGWSKSFGPFFSPCFFSSLYCACCVFGMESCDWHSYVGKVTDFQSEILLQSLQERAHEAGDLLLSTPTPIDPKEYFVTTADTIKLKKSDLERWMHAKNEDPKDRVLQIAALIRSLIQIQHPAGHA